MKFNFLSFRKKGSRKTLSDYKHESILRAGAEQFKKLVEKGISVPVALL
jgi:hypothetical protein